MPFLNNISVKGLYTDYSKEITFLRIRRSVFEHILNLDKALERVEKAGAYIGLKLQFLYNGIVIVKYIYRALSRTLKVSKVKKIVN